VRYALLMLLFACADRYAEEDRATLRHKDAAFGRELEELHASELATRAPACNLYLDTVAADRKARLACRKPDMLRAYGAQQITLKHVRELATIQDPAQLAAACDAAAKDLAADEKCER
jgi:hypothetical protein